MAMADTFARYWPAEIALRVYTEGFTDDMNGRVEFVDLNSAASWLAPWKAARTAQHRGMVGARYDFKHDAVRFSHKVAAMASAADGPLDLLIWMDADTVTHAPVTMDWLIKPFPEPAAVAWLDRAGTYPETGFLMFRLPAARPALAKAVGMYQSGGIFLLPAWTDCHVIQHVVDAARKRGEIEVASLSGDARIHSHVFANSELSKRMDHLKGPRKLAGRTPKRERKIRDEVAYWR